MKKIIFAIMLLFCTTAFGVTLEGWNITVNNIQSREKFFLAEDVETYTGDMIVSELEKKATDKHSFIQVDLTVKKNEANEKNFNSDELKLKVKDKVFQRMDDDSFLSDYNIKPFTRLKIKKGTHNGTIVFEVPNDILNSEKIILLYKGIQVN